MSKKDEKVILNAAEELTENVSETLTEQAELISEQVAENAALNDTENAAENADLNDIKQAIENEGVCDEKLNGKPAKGSPLKSVKAFFGKIFKRRNKNKAPDVSAMDIWERAEYYENLIAELNRQIEEHKAKDPLKVQNYTETLNDLISKSDNARMELLNTQKEAELNARAWEVNREEFKKRLNKDYEIIEQEQAKEEALKQKQNAAKAVAAEQIKTAEGTVDNVAKSSVESVTAESSEEAVAENVAADADEQGEEAKEQIYYKQLSPARMVARRFFRSRLSLIGLIMIVTLFAFAFLGPMIAHACGYRWYETTADDTPTLQTSVEHITVKQGDKEYDVYQVIEKEVDINAKAEPSRSHLIGTDEFGYDVFIRLMYGGRISLTIGFVVVILETILGIIMGGLAGYFGKWVDQIIMRIVDILSCIPTLPMLLIASAVLDSWHIPTQSTIYYLMVIMTIFGWSGTARLVRGQILYLREQEYIVACEVMGIPVWRRILLHLVPNIMPQLIVSMTLGLGGIILYESTLSYLGLGIQIPYAAWGTMISSATNDPTIMANYMHLWIPAGLLIIVAVLGFNFIGDGLRDAMDPKARK